MMQSTYISGSDLAVDPRPRSASARRLAAVFPVLLALSACYQTPHWADPVHWAHEASYQVNTAIEEMKKEAERHRQAKAMPKDPLTPAQAPTMAEKKPKPVTAPEPDKPVKKASKKPSKPTVAMAETKPPPLAPAKVAKPPRKTAEPPLADPRAVETEALPGLPETPKSMTDKAPAKAAAKIPAKPPAKAAMAEKAPATGPKEKKSRIDMAEVEYAVHLASYRKIKTVRKEWTRLVDAHPEHLMGLRLKVGTVELGPRRGTFLRLKAGPLPSRGFAKKLCQSLKKKGLYCAVMRFTGRQAG